jgi:hypothetical protein
MSLTIARADRSSALVRISRLAFLLSHAMTIIVKRITAAKFGQGKYGLSPPAKSRHVMASRQIKNSMILFQMRFFISNLLILKIILERSFNAEFHCLLYNPKEKPGSADHKSEN